MPVYIRKNISYTPASIGNISDEDDNDYLQDPDQLRDVLPQPYRMINKVLDKLLYEVWEIVEAKENKRLAEERKIKPPKYDQPVKLQPHSHATALAESEDGKYIFVGLPNGLAAMDTQTQQTLSHFEDETAEIVTIRCHTINPGHYFLTAIDDMAVGRLFLFASDCLFFVKTLNDLRKPSHVQIRSKDGGGGAKCLVHKCEASLEGDYVGVVLENTATKEVWFEVHKLPRETWIKELEAIEASLPKQREQIQEEKGENTASTDQPQSAPDDGEKTQDKESPRQPLPEPTLDRHKFSPVSLVLKVRPPVPYTANPASSTSSACQKVEKGDILGTGQTHILTAAHLEARDTTFQHMHAGLMKYVSKDENKKPQDVMTATFHFINPGKTLPSFGVESAAQTDRPSGVALWWKGSCHLLQFSLLKVAKDEDHIKAKDRKGSPGGKGKEKDKKGGKPEKDSKDSKSAVPSQVEHKPDVVWPFSCNISASAVSRCTSHIAIGLENGNVTIWDRYIGLPRGVVNMNKSSAVQMLRFLNPSLYPPAPMDYPPYPQRTGTFLLAQYHDSTQYIYDIARNTQDQPFCIGDLPESDDEVQTLLACVPDLPELSLVVQKNGKVYLKDIETGVLVCQLALPDTHQVSSPWEPIISFGGRGELLFVKGEGVQVDEEEDSTTTYRSSLYMFTLRSYPTLDKYWMKTRTKGQLQVHPTIDQRLDALMKERLAQQALRKSRLQMRWGMLRSDLAVIQNARETSSQPASRQFVL